MDIAVCEELTLHLWLLVLGRNEGAQFSIQEDTRLIGIDYHVVP